MGLKNSQYLAQRAIDSAGTGTGIGTNQERLLLQTQDRHIPSAERPTRPLFSGRLLRTHPYLASFDVDSRSRCYVMNRVSVGLSLHYFAE